MPPDDTKQTTKPHARSKRPPNSTLPMTRRPAIFPQVGRLIDSISAHVQKLVSPSLASLFGVILRLPHLLLHPIRRFLLPDNLFWPTLQPLKIAATVQIIRDIGDSRPIDCMVWCEDARALWDNGAFGKGILSRSNSTWLNRYLQRSEQSADTQVFPEDLTELRRRQRVATKDQQTAMESPIGGLADDTSLMEASRMEPVQLSPCETLFLVSLGVLEPRDSVTDLVVCFDDLWDAFSAADGSLAIRYAAYFYYRARGWSVRSGIKFGSDFLLYNGGPAFAHSVYSVVVRLRSSDRNEVLAEEERRGETGGMDLRDSWQYVFALNRVSAQVRKTLVVCYVDPPAESDKRADPSQYTVEELVISRFNPNIKLKAPL